MAIAFTGATYLGNNGGGTGLTAAYTVGSGANRLLVIGFAGGLDGDGDVVTGVTYNGVAMTLASKVAPTLPASNVRWNYLYFLLAPSSGTHDVVISSSAPIFILAAAADYENVKQSGQPDATATKDQIISGTSTTLAITTVANNSWSVLVGTGDDALNAAPSAGAGLTRRAFDTDFGLMGLYDSNGPITPAGSYSMTWTYANTSLEMISNAASYSPDVVATTIFIPDPILQPKSGPFGVVGY